VNAALRFRGVVKRYGRRTALDGLELSVPRGALCGLVGSNGAGKTTAFFLAAGFLRAQAGTIDVLGQGPFDPGRHAGRFAILPQDSDIPPTALPREWLVHLGRLQGLGTAEAGGEADRALAGVHLADRAATAVRTLSHGMKRRLLIAQSFLGAPELVLLDEPLDGLDPREAARVRDALAARRGRQTIVVSSHNLHELERLCDEVIFIEKGRRAGGGPMADVTRSRRVLRFRLGRGEIPWTALREGLPAAHFERADGGPLVCRLPDEDPPVAAANRIVLGALLSAGVEILSVEQGEGLADAYLQTTGGGAESPRPG
jgi:ABC-type multidrug transport system ATPase subunit